MLKKFFFSILLLPFACIQSCYSKNIMQDEIKHVVVVMLENRSFDNILAWLYDKDETPAFFIPESEGVNAYHGLTEETLPLYSNILRNSSGKTIFTCHPIKGIPSTKQTNYLNSPKFGPHEPFPHVMKQICGFDGNETPNMSGFLQDFASLWHEVEWPSNLDEISAVMETYTSNELPILYALAKNYAVSDLWFASVPTQTNPNRAFAICGTSEGETVNGSLGTNKFYADTIWNRLHEESPETTWKIYWQSDMLPGIISGSYHRSLFQALNKIPNVDDFFESVADFHQQARNGELPDFSYIEPQWTLSIGIDDDWLIPDFVQKNFHLGIQGNDLHPPGDVRTAENFIANIYTSLIANTEAWNNTLLIITFDEHGGLYDHVQPPKAISPDGFRQNGFNFDLYGVRVPTIFISPKINKNTIIRSENPVIPFDHTSMLGTILKWKNIDKANWDLGKRTEAAPTFEQVFQGIEARTDAILAVDSDSKEVSIGEPVKMGELFYLKNKDGKYITKPKKLIQQLARTGSESDRIPLFFSNGSGKITHGSFAVIQTNETSLHECNTLEAALTHLDCVYAKPKKTSKQWWTVKSVDYPLLGHDICYGDRIYLENHTYLNLFQFIPARLARNEILPGNFLTVFPITSAQNEEHYWIVEKIE